MNSKQFTLVFFCLTALTMVNGIFDGGVSLVTMGSAVTLPLASAAAGTFATPLAVLGALKLAAVALISAGYIALDDFNRHRRSASGIKTPNEQAVFGLIASMDVYSCGKQLICELEAKPVETLEEDEALLIQLFSKHQKTVDVASPKAEYELAAQLGNISKNQIICRNKYVNCPYTSEEMMAALRNSQI